MASSSFTIKDNFAHTDRASREDTEFEDGKILDMLTSLERDLDDLGLADNQELETTAQGVFSLSRQIFMPTQSQLQEKKLKRLLRLYMEDQSFASKVLPIMEAATEDTLGLPELENLPRSALREMLMESTDDLTTSLGIVSKPGVRILGGLTHLNREGDKLLQEFFEVCREPNMAEIEMLAQSCRVPMRIVSNWFVLKRGQTRRLFVMQGLAAKGSSLGTKLRRREYQSRTEPPACLGPPLEFNDPDLHEGWYDQDESKDEGHANDTSGPEPQQ